MFKPQVLTKLTLIFIITFLAFSTVSATTIHGIVYEWSTFEPLDNALVEVTSTPTQFRVATSGVYSFNLPPGDYLIKTSYYTNDTLEYYTEDNITVTDLEGDYVFDILLFPLQNDCKDFPDEDIGNITYDVEDNSLPSFDWTYTAVALLVMCLAALAAYYHHLDRTGKTDETEAELIAKTEPEPEPELAVEQPPSPLPVTPGPKSLPDDLSELLDIIQQAGGRLTQKDLRSKMKCSEAKVSLMVTDLEDRGLLRKVKQGRGNIILLNNRE
ncbi:MAG: hypothetical protein C5S43_02410 [Candidatus Methanocomedens sp.]|nr:MAG: hypothetical protein C5S43_02410 [ANME-2 cluster archaeon]